MTNEQLHIINDKLQRIRQVRRIRSKYVP
jgi:hypothetical protein